MYIYVWKDANGVPFYVGLTKSIRRTNPLNSPKRNWLCTQKLNDVGREHVIVEIKFVQSMEEGQRLETELIELYGRIQLKTGTLTNLMPGGGGVQPMPEHVKEKRRASLLDPNSPIRTPEAVAKRIAAQKIRMNLPDIKERYSGENNPAKKPEVREKIKAKWQDPDFRAAMIAERIGKPKNFSEEDLARRAEAVKNNPLMKSWGERNGKDPEFEAKRIAGLRASQPQRLAKMADPEALARRKAKLKATLNSPEYLEKRKLWDTPEYRAKLSATRKAYWEKRKAGA